VARSSRMPRGINLYRQRKASCTSRATCEKCSLRLRLRRSAVRPTALVNLVKPRAGRAARGQQAHTVVCWGPGSLHCSCSCQSCTRHLALIIRHVDRHGVLAFMLALNLAFFVSSSSLIYHYLKVSGNYTELATIKQLRKTVKKTN